MNRALALVLCAMLGGCATAPVIVRGCLPPSDLPAKKVMQPLPEVDTSLPDFFALFAEERARHAADQRDYNSLYEQCVKTNG